ncbi:extracellular solute-binding protein [Variovorax sp. PCZ-1]|uniref:ABC transporter substrate-binding protein n=1 Tax=Variovorax sp. PCZ-1 TaxID=2835533 RepID=UPI001BCF0A79|nr:extracellular solute-binding protein [Variovorax sp. PCZ-1]MBS7807908.1 extracellular solute-binding protein [Variovorax sp. PCZ-1]
MKALTIRRTLLAAAALAVALPMTAQARCDKLINPKAGEINIIGATFPALQHIAKEMETCTQSGVKVSFKMSSNNRVETEQAFATAGPSPFDAAVVSGGVFSALQGKSQLQPMTDLVEKYRTKYKIEENMLVRVNGQVMGIAFMQNSLNLYYRKDLFDKHGIKVPTTYAEMLAAAKVLKEKEPSVQYPIAQTFAKGWDSGKEFIDLYVGMGGKLFKAGSAQPDFNSEIGVRTLDLMKSMTPFMTPNFLASNSDDVTNQFQQGQAAMGVFWASRGARMDDPAVSKVVGKIEFAAAPAAVAGGKPASHMWWDGVVMPKNMKGDRDTVFQVLMEALDEDTTRKGNDLATWVRSVYKPTRFASGVAANAKGGTPVWPTEPYAGLAHSELGKVVADVLAGTTPAKAALDTAAAAYVRVATEQGFIK